MERLKVKHNRDREKLQKGLEVTISGALVITWKAAMMVRWDLVVLASRQSKRINSKGGKWKTKLNSEGTFEWIFA
jgi:hypothetical protein